MHDPIQVIVLGTGQMGSDIARTILGKDGLKLAGAYARRQERAGMDLAEAFGLDAETGIAVETDLKALITKSHPDLAIQATCSTLKDAEAEITCLLENAVNVISIAEEMTYPTSASPETAEKLNDLAVRCGVSVLGTGINPGFVLDFLVLVLSGVCSNVRAIKAKRMNDLSPYGPTVLKAQGIGLTPEKFNAGVADGSIAGHYGFSQSIHMIADRLGWQIEQIEQTKEPIVSAVRRETPFVTVEPGCTAGCNHTAIAYMNGAPVIELNHPQQVCPKAEGVETEDAIEIKGTPDIRFSGSPEIPGGTGTAALAVNMIPQVLQAAPGLYSMVDLPAPSATLGDFRDLIKGGHGENKKAVKGTWVEIHSIVLTPEERAPEIPDETKEVALEMRAKGFLVAGASVNEACEITTVTDRRLTGTLSAINPAYEHSFGPAISELTMIGKEVRALLEQQGEIE